MDPVVDTTVRAGFVLLWVAAAMHKARDLRAFRGTLREYRLVPEVVVGPLAWIIPGCEIGLAVSIAWPTGRLAGLLGTALLLLAYAGAVGVNLARGRRDVDCGCFGPGARRRISGWLVGRNVALAVVALVMVGLPVGVRSFVWVDAMTIVAATLTLTASWMATDVLATQARARRRA